MKAVTVFYAFSALTIFSACSGADNSSVGQGTNCQTTCPLGSNVVESREAKSACQASASANAIIQSGGATFACSGEGECLITCQVAIECSDGTLSMSRSADGSEELKCERETDPCAGKDCSGHGRCRNLNGAAQCDCDDGFEADGVQCVARVSYGCDAFCQVDAQCFGLNNCL